MVTDIQTFNPEPDTTVVQVSGQLHAGNTLLTIENTLKRLVDGGVRKLIVDLSQVKLIDSSGIGVLVVTNAQIRQAGGQMRLVCPPGAVGHVLDLVNISQVVPIDVDLESAYTKVKAATA